MLKSIRNCAFTFLCLTFLGYAWNQSKKYSDTPNTSDQTRYTPIDNALDIRYMHQENLLCVPTSASMIMAFYGDYQSPRKLKTMSRGRSYLESASFNDFSINFYRDIIKAATILGYEWREQIFEDNDLGFRQGLDVIKNELSQRRPIMIDLSTPEGHTVVINGFDEKAQMIEVVDPNDSAPGRYSIQYKTLRSIWNEHALNGSFRSLVTTSSRKKSL